MRRYEEIREAHRHEKEEREAEITERIPEIAALDARAASASVSAARKRIISPDADLSSYAEEMRAISAERTRLLTSHGYPADYLEMQYNCPHCRDTGFVDGARCACFKKAAIDLLYSEYSISHVLEKENFRNFSFDWYSDTIQNELTGPGCGSPGKTFYCKCRTAQQQSLHLRQYRCGKNFPHPLHCQRNAGPLLLLSVFFRQRFL